MLKIIFTCLLVGNILLFAYMHSDSSKREVHEPERLANQLNADKLQILTPADVQKRLSQNNDVDHTQEASAKLETSQPKAQNLEKTIKKEITDTKPERTLCLQSEPLKTGALKKLRSWLKRNGYNDNVDEHEDEIAENYLVYIPASKNKETTKERIAKLKIAGIPDYFVLKSKSELPGSISLGVFSTEAAARLHVEHVTAKGINDIQMKPFKSSIVKTLKLKKITASQAKEINIALADLDINKLQKCSTP